MLTQTWPNGTSPAAGLSLLRLRVGPSQWWFLTAFFEQRRTPVSKSTSYGHLYRAATDILTPVLRYGFELSYVRQNSSKPEGFSSVAELSWADSFQDNGFQVSTVRFQVLNEF